ncbi:MAG: pyridine nucleotide-disulfide oxidoreductase [Anaerolineaceae bacterium]|nr:NAD(P)/FAD-dependent oxidoreductase [Anaerolineae bacterium]MBL1172982.1 NAD(P)/FAD-dependent oxidoreductase [Chloroflexota bacterium]MDL1925214.1 NAD(P)/FAD-dependent oxidoreductase [Anaerolineae bacterium AMX1]WKZ50876.1 MAG: FAD-dependent oxidoreductase [Anaerolineales bacterium]GJQ39795.1 MAG: pyridine nucleotide-disulfide oxidoreductase [Anaerolineaceae bacterium]
MTRYLILGMGVAGIAAAEAIRSTAPGAEILLLSDDPFGYYSRPGLAYYLTGEMAEKQLFPFTIGDFHKLHSRYVQGRATAIFRGERQIEVDGKNRISYDRLLIAVGARALPLTVPGAHLEGVLKLDHMGDARQILQASRRAKHAAVVGGGITALELAEGLLSQRVKTTYLLRGDRYWSSVLDEQESLIVEERLREQGVELIRRAELLEAFGRRGRVEGIRLLDGRALRCDLLAYAIGIQPRVELARDAGLAVDKGILVNECLQTNDPDIFAAGDAAQAYDPLTGRSIIDSLWNPAREQGRVAGLNMAGKKTAYLKSVPFNVTRLAGLTTTIIGAIGRGGRDEDLVGIARGDSETFRSLPDAILAQSGFDVNHLRLMIGRKTLLGALVMGDQTLSMPLQKMIADGADITPIRSRLLARDTRIADVVAEFWKEWSKTPAAA